MAKATSPPALGYFLARPNSHRKGRRKKWGEENLCNWICSENWGFQALKRPQSMGTGVFNDKRSPLGEALQSGRLEPWWRCMKQWQVKEVQYSKGGSMRKIFRVPCSVSFYQGAKFSRNPRSQKFHIGWIWEASKERQKDSHSPKVKPGEMEAQGRPYC